MPIYFRLFYNAWSFLLWVESMIKSILVVISFALNAFCEEEHLFAGKHFLASYLSCDRQAIGNLQGILNAVDEAVHASGATILNSTPYIFPPNGLTVVYLLSESHASLHTYPEYGACFVDLFTCGDQCCAEKFDAVLRAYLKPKEVNAKLFSRNNEIDEIAYYPIGVNETCSQHQK